MTPPGGRSAIPFLLQPWRYDAEGSRDWAAARFAIFTVTSPEPTMRRLGGKARGGRLPRGPLGRLPARLWMQLTERGLLVAGDGWDVAVTSTSRRAAAPGQAWVARCAHAVDARQPERHLRRAQTWVADLQVDDSLVTFFLTFQGSVSANSRHVHHVCAVAVLPTKFTMNPLLFVVQL